MAELSDYQHHHKLTDWLVLQTVDHGYPYLLGTTETNH